MTSCTHTGHCDSNQPASQCALVQRAEARKYDANLCWHIAELRPDIWCLYSPDRRRPMAIGSLDEIILAYRNREPVVFQRVSLDPKPKNKLLQGLEFNL